MGQALARIDELGAVKADLAARIAAIDVRAPYAQARDLAPEIDAIRVIAHRNGLNPAVTVAHFVDSALSRGEHGALVHGWLSILGDAIVSERQDVQACHAFAAACSVRLAG
ncbi:hypothetical protein U1701_02680 [Sphingomonas sp. PB2P19]|uniref:hypothetical protein n=1 Tax=Sphingomonas rhamnosi TaxID=3096156 RepID=UPI002FCC655F